MDMAKFNFYMILFDFHEFVPCFAVDIGRTNLRFWHLSDFCLVPLSILDEKISDFDISVFCLVSLSILDEKISNFEIF